MFVSGQEITKKIDQRIVGFRNEDEKHFERSGTAIHIFEGGIIICISVN